MKPEPVIHPIHEVAAPRRKGEPFRSWQGTMSCLNRLDLTLFGIAVLAPRRVDPLPMRLATPREVGFPRFFNAGG
jgi:hypothetical protein